MFYYKNKNKNKKNKNKHNLTKKQNPSELIKPSLSKKALNINPILKRNLNLKNKKFYKKDKKETHDNTHDGKLLDNNNETHLLLKGGEMKAFTKFNLSNYETFAVSSGTQYKILRFKIRLQKLTTSDKFTIALLDVHKYLARLNLDYIKLEVAISKLVGNNKHLAKVQIMIDDLIELEKIFHSTSLLQMSNMAK